MQILVFYDKLSQGLGGDCLEEGGRANFVSGIQGTITLMGIQGCAKITDQERRPSLKLGKEEKRDL